MNDFTGHGRFNAMYYWEQFHPILSAVAILLVGWIIALLVAAGVKKSAKTGNQSKAFECNGVHRSNIENIVSRVVFWIILVIAVIGALNVLNLTSVSGPFSNMIQQFLLIYSTALGCGSCRFYWLDRGEFGQSRFKETA